MAAAVIALLALPLAAHAQLASTIYAVGQYQYNSNVFALQSGFPSGPNDYQHDDRYFAYGAGVNLAYQVSQQNLYFQGSVTQYDYDHFSELTHLEYNLNGGWRWKFADNLTGSLNGAHSRTMVPFIQVFAVSMVLSTDQRYTATLDYEFIPTWHFAADAYTDKNEQPQPLEPNLNLVDNGADASIRFLGGAGVTGGFTVGYQHGSYMNAIVFHDPSYNEWSYGLVAAYRPSGPAGATVVDFGAGYTNRDSGAAANDLSSWTGHLDLNRTLTGKTSIEAALSRNVNSYVTNAGSEIDSSAAIVARWQATYKTSFNLGYTWLYSVFPQQGFVPGTTRHDHLQFATFTISYSPAAWLTVRPYVNYQTRASDYFGGNFNATIYGVLFTVQWQNRAAAGSAFGPDMILGQGAGGAPTGLPAAVP